jgi:CCR4-NOT transcription complex subunit 9
MEKEQEKVVQLINSLRDADRREETLNELSKKKDEFSDLALYLWYSVGTVSILLQEVISIYQNLNPVSLTPQFSTRICSVLGLLQCLALHPETRTQFLNAYIPLFLYPLLNTTQYK